MSDYTPHIGEIRDAVAGGWDYAYITPAEFDRWLAAHDAEIRRIAFVEIVNGVKLIDVCEKDAYQRGRKDATQAVQSVNRYDAGFGTDHDWCHIRRDEAIAAARGDDEQA